MSSRPFRAAFALAFASAAPAALLTALVDLVVTWGHAGEPVGAAALGWAALAAFGLYGAFAAVVAAGEAIVGGGLAATFDVGAATHRFVDGARRDPAYDAAPPPPSSPPRSPSASSAPSCSSTTAPSPRRWRPSATRS